VPCTALCLGAAYAEGGGGELVGVAPHHGREGPYMIVSLLFTTTIQNNSSTSLSLFSLFMFYLFYLL
jgi:hypothetical protein